MANKMPEAIDSYFAAKKSNDVEAMLASFDEDATVKDEERMHRGKDAIRAWIKDTNSRYKYTVEVLDSKGSGSSTIVHCRLEGDFPGSPVEIDYRFTLKDGKIAGLATE